MITQEQVADYVAENPGCNSGDVGLHFGVRRELINQTYRSDLHGDKFDKNYLGIYKNKYIITDNFTFTVTPFYQLWVNAKRQRILKPDPIPDPIPIDVPDPIPDPIPIDVQDPIKVKPVVKAQVKVNEHIDSVRKSSCKLCGAIGTNMRTCPLNPKAVKPQPSKHQI
jgi:hypothetical protein